MADMNKINNEELFTVINGWDNSVEMTGTMEECQKFISEMEELTSQTFFIQIVEDEDDYAEEEDSDEEDGIVWDDTSIMATRRYFSSFSKGDFGEVYSTNSYPFHGEDDPNGNEVEGADGYFSIGISAARTYYVDLEGKVGIEDRRFLGFNNLMEAKAFIYKNINKSME